MAWTEVSWESLERAVKCADFFMDLRKKKESEERQFKDKIKQIEQENGLITTLAMDEIKEDLFERCSSKDKEQVEELIKKVPIRYTFFRDGLIRKLNYSSNNKDISIDRTELFILDFFLGEDIYDFYEKNVERTFAVADPDCISSLSLSDEDKKVLQDKGKKILFKGILAVLFIGSIMVLGGGD